YRPVARRHGLRLRPNAPIVGAGRYEEQVRPRHSPEVLPGDRAAMIGEEHVTERMADPRGETAANRLVEPRGDAERERQGVFLGPSDFGDLSAGEIVDEAAL